MIESPSFLPEDLIAVFVLDNIQRHLELEIALIRRFGFSKSSQPNGLSHETRRLRLQANWFDELTEVYLLTHP